MDEQEIQSHESDDFVRHEQKLSKYEVEKLVKQQIKQSMPNASRKQRRAQLAHLKRLAGASTKR